MTLHPWRVLGAVLILFVSANVEAALFGRLPATSGGTDYHAYYDDVLDITWVSNANLAASNTFGLAYNADLGDYPGDYFGLLYTEQVLTDGRMIWGGARHWIDAMNADGGTGYLGYNDWRLPTLLDSGNPGCNFTYAGTDRGYNVDGQRCDHGRQRDGESLVGTTHWATWPTTIPAARVLRPAGPDQHRAVQQRPVQPLLVGDGEWSGAESQPDRVVLQHYQWNPEASRPSSLSLSTGLVGRCAAAMSALPSCRFTLPCGYSVAGYWVSWVLVDSADGEASGIRTMQMASAITQTIPTGHAGQHEPPAGGNR